MATVTAARSRTGRGTELLMTLLAVLIGLGGLALVAWNIDGELPASFVKYAALFGGSVLVLHAVIRFIAPHADPLILPIVTALNGIGIVMIYRIDLAEIARGNPSAVADRQLLWMVIGIVGAIITLFVVRDHRGLRRLPYLAATAGIILLLSPLLPGIGRTINGARLWVGIGSVQFQPAELSKILLAIFFAGYLVTHRDRLTLAGPKFLGIQLPRIVDFGPLIAVWAACILVLVSQRDLGTSLLFFGLFVAMLYVATERTSWIILGLAMFAIGVFIAVNSFGHVAARFDIWLDAMSQDAYARSPGGSYQLVNGLFGLASGGLFGTGLGNGYPLLVPYSNSDFIFTSLGEELGLTGLMAILMMYVLLVHRCLRAGIGVRDGFGKLLATGIGFSIAFQVFVVVGGVTRLIPLTGLTLPFVAAGGTSLVTNWVMIALLIRMSDGARRPAPVQAVSQETGLIAVSMLQEAESEHITGRARRSRGDDTAEIPPVPDPGIPGSAEEPYSEDPGSDDDRGTL
ncbi:MAG TPA: FtsW/RodA/SpoVE family cell cycle protein [Beutenbergiaceae bacterium]|nr:FtsW/RodA/SpoVE family cell cycle protein [Beutenbergiaceae bacterium]